MKILKELRLKKGISQQIVSDYLEITRQAYSNYENGSRQPDNETLLKLGEFFDVTVNYLLTGTEKVPTTEGEHEIKNPDIRMIARAGNKMTPEQAENLRKYAQFMFPEAFNDDK